MEQIDDRLVNISIYVCLRFYPMSLRFEFFCCCVLMMS
jgi:hypothetical protein